MSDSFATSHARRSVAYELRTKWRELVMAMKIKMLTLLEEQRGYARITNRLPAPQPGVLYLMKLRARTTQNCAPKRRLSITVETSSTPAVPLPVKIIHVDPAAKALRVFVR